MEESFSLYIEGQIGTSFGVNTDLSTVGQKDVAVFF